jgi:hypothetical protein
MLKSITLAVAFVATASCFQAANADTSYVIHSWPGDLARIPCDAWTRKEDGSWGQTGTITVEAATMVIKNYTFANGTDIAQSISKKCGANK